jgi:hypothetical protein
MSKSKRIEGEYTNEYGTYNPGDKVIAITVCTGNVYVELVEYLGYVERMQWCYKTHQRVLQKFVQIRRTTKKFTAFWKGTDEQACWPYGDREVEGRYVYGTTVTTLQHNRILPSNIQALDLAKAI